VRIVKPYADRDKVMDQFSHAQQLGAIAIGMDIDHIFGDDGDFDVVLGERMARQTMSDLREYVSAFSLPFVVKGVLSVRDAVKCAECGAAAILISHHHGRMPFAAPPLMLLPEIYREVGGTHGVKIFVDCGIDTGADAYKALALGADAVAVGRAMMPSLQQDGVQGVYDYIKAMNDELAMIMAFTGCASLAEITSSALWREGRRL